ncbi:hypothetical protein [Methanococcus aeolicus]|uniref:hypothetical protein n=1 Tax=Methanococcus aeolicus TaxID=42879 RepID=UPI0021C58D33|nr:hypothetical protein [Methanococcus aeolicus]UXM85322.1 hypothetical protein N6C89_03340 [Methanococcus aeolicus]
MEIKQFKCSKCEKIIEVPYGTPKPETCPHCGAPSTLIHRIDGGGMGMGMGHGRRCGSR